MAGPPPTPPARQQQPQATASKTKSLVVFSHGSVRVDASLPLGVVVGDGRGKLLPMRACGRGYTNSCGGVSREPQFLSITCLNSVLERLESFSIVKSIYLEVSSNFRELSLLLPYCSHFTTKMSAIRYSIRAATPLLRSSQPNVLYRATIGSYTSIARLQKLPNTIHRVTRAAVRCYASSSEQVNAKTSLYDLHVSKGAKMVPFGGYMMPVQYSDLGVGESHKWTREKASLFDVSHM